ncbi:hypothetical protein HYT25_02340 [Candidatus Pacearchaeota archaeon]|nr:hypothetical protein [Candidatus Pacearchaeota archaeon]
MQEIEFEENIGKMVDFPWKEEDFDFAKEPIKKTKRELSPVERLEESYKNSWIEKRKSFYFNTKAYENLPASLSYSYRATIKTSKGFKTLTNLTEEGLTGFLEEVGEKSSSTVSGPGLIQRPIIKGYNIGIGMQNGKMVSSEEECGYIIEVYDPSQPIEILRIGEDGFIYENKGKRKPQIKKEMFYNRRRYSNAYAFRGKAKDLENCFFSANIKAVHMVKSNKPKFLN